MVHEIGVSSCDGIVLSALCVRLGTWELCCDARMLACEVGVDFRGDLCLHALRFSHGTRVLGGDVASTHQRVHGWPRQSDADRR
eukprot:3840438-Pleurochrysis_carterae.AAC.2